jgi:transcriptional regulator with XRE-family HTH domain
VSAENFAARLRTARLAAGLLQEELAEKVGVSRTQIANLEGDRTAPSVTTLIGICRACNVSADVLLGLETAPPDLARMAELQDEVNALRTFIRATGASLLRVANRG